MAAMNLSRFLDAVVYLLTCILCISPFLCGPVYAEDQFRSNCVRNTKMTQNEPQGIRFVLSENDCDTFGNSLFSTIYASDPQGRHRVALITFGPDTRSPPPMISIDEKDKTIVIAIDSVAELVKQTNAYGAYKVIYRIKHVVYPPSKAK